MKSGCSIAIVTPAGPGSRAGNRVTAERWQAILEDLGHRVTVTTGADGPAADILIAIHAWRSADAIARFRRSFPQAPIVVCLAGTDVYRFQKTHPDATRAALDAATALVGLHDLVGQSIPLRYRGKLRVIHQSVPPLVRQHPRTSHFDVCVIGHMRDEKDPLRAAYAARLLPPQSKVLVTHAGGALDPAWAASASAEMAANPRYRWLGEISRDDVRALLSTARVMVLSSIMEGGANVLGEAISAGVPAIVSEIEGSIGIVGAGYPGTFPVGDTAALAAQLGRAESEPAFLAELSRRCGLRARLFEPAREREAWRALIEELTVAYALPIHGR